MRPREPGHGSETLGSPQRRGTHSPQAESLCLLFRERFIQEAQASTALTSPSLDDGDKASTLWDRILMQPEGKGVRGVVSWRSAPH